MIVDHRDDGNAGVVFNEKERKDILREAHYFDFADPGTAGQFLPENPNNVVLYVFRVMNNGPDNAQTCLLIKTKSGVESAVTTPNNLLIALSNPGLKVDVNEKLMEKLQFHTPTLYRLFRLKRVSKDVTAETEGVVA